MARLICVNHLRHVRVALVALVLAMPAVIGTANAAHAVAPAQAVAWGDNSSGQFCDGTTTSRDLPVGTKLSQVTAVSAGEGQTLALAANGSVTACGSNGVGELGDGTTTNSATPVAVALPAGVRATAVSAGGGFSLALTAAGHVLAWGGNGSGQLGDGSTTNRTAPVFVKLPAGVRVTAISAGGSSSLALTSAGQVLAWGTNLGDGTSNSSSVPVATKLPANTGATAVAAGTDADYVLTSTGSVLSWGIGSSGELGDGRTANSTTPVSVSLPSGVTATGIAGAELGGYALTSTGQVLAWGDGGFGQLGNGTTSTSTTPVSVSLPSGTSVRALATSAGAQFCLALTSTGSVLGWGTNGNGELGNGSTTESTTPTSVDLGGLPVAALAAGNQYALAITGPPPRPYHPLTPARLADTRSGSGEPDAGKTLGPGQTLDVQVAGMGGVPASGASA
ncbi:MAG TPA: hypothetical protein VF005_00795, partial [Acidimicrobiales bacterium]